jgi:hypothetical protein
MRGSIIAILLAACACTLSAQAAERIYTPTQAAYLKGEIRKAQEQFVARVAAISGVPDRKIREWVVTDGRDVPHKVNIVPALQRERSKPFTEEERAQILAADQERYDAIEKAKQAALQK